MPGIRGMQQGSLQCASWVGQVAMEEPCSHLRCDSGLSLSSLKSPGSRHSSQTQEEEAAAMKMADGRHSLGRWAVWRAHAVA